MFFLLFSKFSMQCFFFALRCFLMPPTFEEFKKTMKLLDFHRRVTIVYVSRFGWRHSLTCAPEVKTGQHLVWISHVKGHRPHFHGLKSDFFVFDIKLSGGRHWMTCKNKKSFLWTWKLSWNWWQPRCLYQLVWCYSFLISPYRSYVFFFNKTSVPHKSKFPPFIFSFVS